MNNILRIKDFIPKARSSPEYIQMGMFFDLMQYEANRDPRYGMAFHIANAGKVTRKGSYSKIPGIKKGVPDVFVALPHAGFHGMFIEFKIPPNKLTEDQEIWFEKLSNKKYYCVVCYSGQAAFRRFQAYLLAPETPTK